MMKFIKFFFALLLTFLGTALVLGCSASRKIQAAKILGKCELEISEVSLDSAHVDLDKILGGTALGGFVPNPKTILLIQNVAKGMIPDSLGTLYFAIHIAVKNPSEDTLWLRSANGSVLLDSLVSLPIAFRDSAKLLPGVSPVEFHTHLQIGPVLMKILSAETIRFSGNLEFSLSPAGEPISFAVDKEKKIQPEDRTAFIDKARTEILSTLTEVWTSTFKR